MIEFIEYLINNDACISSSKLYFLIDRIYCSSFTFTLKCISHAFNSSFILKCDLFIFPTIILI